MLMKLAVAENEEFGNNARGIFNQLFQLYLSGTEAEPSARLLVLDSGLNSRDSVERGICVEALSQMLDSGHFSRSGGAEQIGSGDALEDWRPKTYGEIHDFARAAILRLTRIATSNDECALVAKGHLGTHIRGLLNELPATEVKSLINTITAHYGFWPDALIGISHWLYFDREKSTPPRVSMEVRGLYDELLPTDPVDLAVLYTHGWHSDLHDPDSTYDRDPNANHDFDYAARKSLALAVAIAKDTELITQVVERLACSDGHMLFPFAKELMKCVENPKSLFEHALKVAEGSAQPPDRDFFGGLISGADARSQQLSVTLIRLALQSPKLKGSAIALIGSGGLGPDDIALVISLLKSGDIKPWQVESLRLWQIDVKLVMGVLRELERHGNDGLWSILDIVGMYLHGGQNTAPKELAAFIKRVVVNPALMEAVRHNMDGYHLEQVVGHLVKLGAIDETYAKKLAKQVLRTVGGNR